MAPLGGWWVVGWWDGGWVVVGGRSRSKLRGRCASCSLLPAPCTTLSLTFVHPVLGYSDADSVPINQLVERKHEAVRQNHRDCARGQGLGQPVAEEGVAARDQREAGVGEQVAVPEPRRSWEGAVGVHVHLVAAEHRDVHPLRRVVARREGLPHRVSLAAAPAVVAVGVVVVVTAAVVVVVAVG